MDDPAFSGNSLNLALIQLPSRMRQALLRFRKITGLAAVTSLASSLPEEGVALALAPPIHPRCTTRLRGAVNPPCNEQWQRHLRQSRKPARIHSHVCPFGLRCTCVTIRLGGHPVGIAKLVVGPDTPERAVAAATSVLEIVVSGACQDLLNSALKQDVEALQRRVASLLLVHGRSSPGTGGPGKAACAPPGIEPQNGRSSLVQNAVACLQRRYREQGLSVTDVAEELGCHPRYLSSRFYEKVGEQMHVYLAGLRVDHACRLLMETGLLVKQVAQECGFAGQGQFARTFHRHVGVSPLEYRHIFAGHRVAHESPPAAPTALRPPLDLTSRRTI